MLLALYRIILQSPFICITIHIMHTIFIACPIGIFKYFVISVIRVRILAYNLLLGLVNKVEDPPYRKPNYEGQ
jgi:hypothetical protein